MQLRKSVIGILVVLVFGSAGGYAVYLKKTSNLLFETIEANKNKQSCDNFCGD